MKSKQRVIGILACGLCAAVVAPTASAEVKRGFYIGLRGGESTFDLEKEEFDDIVVDSFFVAGAGSVMSGSSSFEDSDTTIALIAGYQILPYLAVEASYIDLGAAEYTWTGTLNPPGPAINVPAAMHFTAETEGFSMNGIASLPLGRHFDLHGRFGFLIADTKLKVDATIGGTTGRDSEKFDSENLLFGVGAGFHLGEHWSLNLDWTRYDNVGDGDEDDDEDTDEGFDVDALTFSAMFRF